MVPLHRMQMVLPLLLAGPALAGCLDTLSPPEAAARDCIGPNKRTDPNLADDWGVHFYQLPRNLTEGSTYLDGRVIGILYDSQVAIVNATRPDFQEAACRDPNVMYVAQAGREKGL